MGSNSLDREQGGGGGRSLNKMIDCLLAAVATRLHNVDFVRYVGQSTSHAIVPDTWPSLRIKSRRIRRAQLRQRIRAIKDARGFGDVEALRFVSTWPTDVLITAMMAAAEHGCATALAFFADGPGRGLVPVLPLLNAAAAHGHLASVTLLLSRPAVRRDRCAVRSAAVNGHVNVVRCLCECGDDAVGFDRDTLIYIQSGSVQLPVLDYIATLPWLRGDDHIIVNMARRDAAIRDCNLQRIRVEHTACSKGCSDITVFKRLDLAALDWLRDHCMKDYSNAVAWAAADQGNLAALEWAFRCRPSIAEGPMSSSLLAQAARRGHWHAVRWMMAHGFRSIGLPMIIACRGDLDMLRYVHAEWGVGIGEWVLEEAARKGHTPVVRWLLEQGLAYCTGPVLVCAARSGNLDVLTFLLATRSADAHRDVAIAQTLRSGVPLAAAKVLLAHAVHPDVTDCGQRMALWCAAHGDLAGLAWLAARNPQSLTASAVMPDSFVDTSDAVVPECVRFDVVKWFCRHRPDVSVSTAFLEAALGSLLTVVAYLLKRRPAECDVNDILDSHRKHYCEDTVRLVQALCPKASPHPAIAHATAEFWRLRDLHSALYGRT